jgi:hypothetical protein
MVFLSKGIKEPRAIEVLEPDYKNIRLFLFVFFVDCWVIFTVRDVVVFSVVFVCGWFAVVEVDSCVLSCSKRQEKRFRQCLALSTGLFPSKENGLYKPEKVKIVE